MTDTPITDLLGLAENDDESRSRLFELLIRDLRQIAAGLMRGEALDHTLQATALVNEAVLRQNFVKGAINSKQVFGRATMLMKRVLIDHARRRKSEKRGGLVKRLSIDVAIEKLDNTGEMPDVVGAVELLIKENQEVGEAIDLRYFAGLTNAEVAVVQSVSEREVERRVQRGRARLKELLR